MKNNVCYACLKDGEDVYSMPAADVYWYSRLIKEMPNDTEPLMCAHCTGLFRKSIVFVEQCLKAQIFLKQMYSKELEQLPTSIGHSLVISPMKTYYLGPELIQDLDIDVKAEDSVPESNAYITEDEDDVPLVLLCDDNGAIENVNMETEKKDLLDTVKSKTVELKSAKESIPSKVRKKRQIKSKKQKKTLKEGFTSRMVQETTEYIVIKLTKEQVLEEMRERLKSDKYMRAPYKCEDCVKGFNFEDVLQSHMDKHSPNNGTFQCEICKQCCPSQVSFRGHMKSHTSRYKCKLCGYIRLSRQHVLEHYTISHSDASAAYSCENCKFTTKNSRARKNHVARFHRQGLQCDHCKKRFVNRATLTTHLRLHDGPPPRSQCPICHKMVQDIQLKYHIQRHQNRGRYECADCNKTFSHLTTYHAHLKYSRAHATEHVFKFPCPMCNKGYPTKEAMQDHFNYQHLGKTSHKCPICSKPIASRANVEKHMRVHREKNEKPRNHICQQCGKAFTDKKALTQHEVIHSGERPLSCDICQQTFKQKASLYTHKKRVHHVAPAKRVVEFMETKNAET